MVATLPIFRVTNCRAAQTLAPELMPTSSPFSLTQAPGGGNRLFIGNLHDLVHQSKIENVRDKTIANALNLVQARLMPEDGRDIPGFNHYHFYFVVLFFEKFTHILQGSTASYPSHKTHQVTCHLLP
jgi:hypothetical protein